MADKKTGPVKPPILDMKARENAAAKETTDTTRSASASGEQPREGGEKQPRNAASHEDSSGKQGDGAKPAPGPSSQSKTEGAKPASPEKPAPQQQKRDAAPPSATPLALTALAGGLVGLALAWGIAYFGYWPQADTGPDVDRVAALETRMAELESASQNGGTSTAQFAERLEALEVGLEEAAADIAALGDAATPQAASTEFEQLAQTVSALSERVQSLQAAPQGGEAAPSSPDISGIEERLSAIETGYEDVVARMQDLQASAQSADERLQDLETRIADQSDFEELSAERDRLARLPAALAGLETAIASGAPFANELAAVTALQPGLEPPEAAQAAAASGVKSSQTLLTEFRALIPDLIAARPDAPNQDWFETLVDQATTALALRPTGDEGNDASALIGRTETALENGEVERAREIIAAYPPGMAQIAQPLAADIDAHLAAYGLLADARAVQSAAEESQ